MAVHYATYTPSELQLHKYNPYIEALPPFLTFSKGDFRKILARVPEPFHPQATRGQKGSWLLSLNRNLFIPLTRHIQLMEMIDLVIRQGYVPRSPLSEEEEAYYQNAYERLQKGEKVNVDFSRMNADAYRGEPLSLALIGCSGVGKSFALARILSKYPQVIRHKPPRVREEFDQIVYLQVECPHEGSVKSLCTDILAAIDAVTGEHWSASFKQSRVTLSLLKQRVVQIMALHQVGLLVIDEIQNLLVSRKSREELFNFIVSLGNALNVPILYVGTPKIRKFMSSDLRVARRFGSCGIFCWDRLEQGDKGWNELIRGLWDCNTLKEAPAEIPQEVEDALYRYSQGVPGILTNLFTLSLLRAMSLKNTPLSTELIEWIFNEHFSGVEPIIKALEANDSEALAHYEDISFSPEAYLEAGQKYLEDIYKAETSSEESPSAQLNEEATRQILNKADGEAFPLRPQLVGMLEDIIKDGGLSLSETESMLKELLDKVQKKKE